jgi:oxygen-dependent protoporphyrinogen oxidase
MTEVVVLGGGISGLSTAYQIQEMAKKEGLKINLTLIEKENRLGGKIMSIKERGFLCEAGPAAFLDSKPETLKLADAIGLKTFPSNEVAKKRFIYTRNKLQRVPEKPVAFLRSNILSIKGRLRVLLEPFSKPTDERDETIASFGERHLGREAQEKLISAMVIGIFAGDSKKLSLRSCFPVMLELENEGNGSLIKGMIRRMKKARKDPNARTTPAGNLTSFKDGMESLTKGVSKALKGRVLTGKTVKSVKKGEKSGYEVFLKGEKRSLKADILVLAVPAYSAADFIRELDPELGKELEGITYAPASIVCLGYRNEDVPNSTDGFGFLIPKIESRRILGCRWDSSAFNGRAPPGHVLLWTIVGGDLNPALAFLDDQALLTLVKEELKEIMGITKEPTYTRIVRHEKAIPQYVVGHSKCLERIKNRVKRYPGLFVTGNAFKGVGINDCTKNASIIARAVVEHVKGLSA